MRWVLLTVLAVVAACRCAAADEVRLDSFQRGQREIGLLLGYAETYHMPSAAGVSARFESAKFRYARFTSPKTQIAFELSGSTQIRGAHNFFTTALFNYRRYFARSRNTAVGLDLSIGGEYMKDKVEGQATRLNFAEQVGLVIEHSISTRTALTLELRFCHVSNAGIELPNIGLNSGVIRVGCAWYR